jgi:hypothetical protein
MADGGQSAAPSLVERVETKVRQSTHGRIRNLVVEEVAGQVIVSGQAPSRSSPCSRRCSFPRARLKSTIASTSPHSGRRAFQAAIGVSFLQLNLRARRLSTIVGLKGTFA